MVIIPMKDLKKAFTCTAIVLLCCAMISLSGCGVFLLGDPSGDKAPEDTGVQTMEPVSDFEAVENDYSRELTRFKVDLSTQTYGGASVKIASTKSNTIVPAI